MNDVVTGTYLGGVDDLVGESLSNALEGAESGLLSTLVHEVESLINATERGDIDGLAADDTTRTNTSGVLTGTGIGASVNKDLKGVLAGKQVDELEGLLNDLEGLLLFTVSAGSRGHDSVDEALNKGALDLLEATLLVAASGVRHEDLLFDSFDVDIIFKGGFIAHNALIAPSAETEGLASEKGLVVTTLGLGISIVICHLVFKG